MTTQKEQSALTQWIQRRAQQPLVSLRNVYFSYDQLPVLEKINLDIHQGEFLGIVGPNAGGKSTLLKLMLGLLKPHSGQIDVFSQSARAMSHRIGYVPQYPTFSRDFPMTVETLVLLGSLNNQAGFKAMLPGRFSRADRERAQQVLHEVEASAFAGKQIGHLSGGQLQRVLLARALISNPQLLLLDEPTSNIDHRLENEIFDLLKELNKHVTILVVSHDIAFVSSYVSRVACVNRTLVCHDTSSISGDVISDLYGGDVRVVAHSHSA